MSQLLPASSVAAMTSQERAFLDFSALVVTLEGEEKSETQRFLLHLLEAFGHDTNIPPEGTIFDDRVHFPDTSEGYPAPSQVLTADWVKSTRV